MEISISKGGKETHGDCNGIGDGVSLGTVSGSSRNRLEVDNPIVEEEEEEEEEQDLKSDHLVLRGRLPPPTIPTGTS